MYANLNLEGRIVSDPEFRTGKGDREYCTFGIVVNEQYGGQEIASFYNCSGNDQIASRIRKANLSKGRMIHITGKLTLREYQTRNNETRLSADVGILDWNFTGSKPKSDDASKNPTAIPNSAGNGTVNEEQYIGEADDLPI